MLWYEWLFDLTLLDSKKVIVSGTMMPYSYLVNEINSTGGENDEDKGYILDKAMEAARHPEQSRPRINELTMDA